MKFIYKTAVGCMLTACFALPAVADNTTPDTSTVTVPIQMTGSQNDTQPAVSISVAGGPPTLVNLDTGSIGLHIYASQVGNQNITYTTRVVKNGYASGEMFEGVLAYAPVTIGGVTSASIPIIVIKKAYCIASKPDCPIAHQDPNNPQPQNGMYGIMGVSMATILDKHRPKQTLYSPLRALPGNYGSGFIIENLSNAGGQLVIGLNADNTAGFNKVSLPQTDTYSDGSPIFNDKALEVKYTIGHTTRLLQTAFDSGGDPDIHLYSSHGSLGFMSTRNHQAIRPGENFSAVLDNGFTWQFTTGKDEGSNYIRIQPVPPGKDVKAYLNTGSTFFQYFDVMYDVKNGQLGFKSHS